MGNRKYTGWDRNATGRRAGTEKLIQLIQYTSGKALWNNGSFVVRNKRGKSTPSVHATGRAFDLSWRNMGPSKGSGRYEDAKAWLELLTRPDVADALGIEAVFDYWNEAGPHGRGWKCDRQDNGNGGWVVYDKRAFAGVPGDWIHVEVSNATADDPAHMDKVFKAIFAGELGNQAAPAPKPASAPRPAPGKENTPSRPYKRSIKRGSTGSTVKVVQERLNELGHNVGRVDGKFGPRTEKGVRDFQAANQPAAGPVDGWVGRITWGVLFP